MSSVTESPLFSVREVNWHANENALRAIRRKVFAEEQHVAEEPEWDGEDEFMEAGIPHVLMSRPTQTGEQ